MRACLYVAHSNRLSLLDFVAVYSKVSSSWLSTSLDWRGILSDNRSRLHSDGSWRLLRVCSMCQTVNGLWAVRAHAA